MCVFTQDGVTSLAEAARSSDRTDESFGYDVVKPVSALFSRRPSYIYLTFRCSPLSAAKNAPDFGHPQ